MDTKEVKAYLRRYVTADREIDRKLDELARLRERATKVVLPLDTDRVQVSPRDHVSEIVAKIADMEVEINTDIDRLQQMKVEIEAAIEKVGDEKLELLLRYRYIDGLRWEEIAVKMGYSYYHVVGRLHPEALKKIKDVIECYI